MVISTIIPDNDTLIGPTAKEGYKRKNILSGIAQILLKKMSRNFCPSRVDLNRQLLELQVATLPIELGCLCSNPGFRV